MKINNFQGEVTDVSAKKEPLAISNLNRMTVPVIGIDSSSTQLSELLRPPHHPKWPRAGQPLFFSRKIGLVTPKIIYFHYL